MNAIVPPSIKSVLLASEGVAGNFPLKLAQQWIIVIHCMENGLKRRTWFAKAQVLLQPLL